jgi:uncharacterized protein (DUF4415 family)
MTVSNSATDPNWIDPDDAPELTEAWFAKADFKMGDKVIRKGGRPRGSDKEMVTIRLDKAAIEYFRDGTPGWQTRINDALRKAAGL